MFEAGKVASVTELAERLDVDRSYAARILRLNLLAPDIVGAILAGRHPSGFSLAKLTRTLPVLWHEQRELFRFPLDLTSLVGQLYHHPPRCEVGRMGWLGKSVPTQ